MEADRHCEALAEMEGAGVTAVVVSSLTRTPAATFEFLEAFGATYLSRPDCTAGGNAPPSDVAS